jgi:hypothetical protein
MTWYHGVEQQQRSNCVSNKKATTRQSTIQNWCHAHANLPTRYYGMNDKCWSLSNSTDHGQAHDTMVSTSKRGATVSNKITRAQQSTAHNTNQPLANLPKSYFGTNDECRLLANSNDKAWSIDNMVPNGNRGATVWATKLQELDNQPLKIQTDHTQTYLKAISERMTSVGCSPIRTLRFDWSITRCRMATEEQLCEKQNYKNLTINHSKYKPTTRKLT